MKKSLKGTNEFQFFKEFWALHQDYYTPEKDSRYWDNLVANASGLIEKYKDTDFGRFAAELVQAVLMNQERKSQGMNLKYDIREIEAEHKQKERYAVKDYLRGKENMTVKEVLDEL